MRRLPIFILIDNSDDIELSLVNGCISKMIKDFSCDPFALETYFIHVESNDAVIFPLTDIATLSNISNNINDIVHSATDINIGTSNLLDHVAKEIKKSTREEKGDWRPIIIFFTNDSNKITTSNFGSIDKMSGNVIINFQTTVTPNSYNIEHKIVHLTIDLDKSFNIRRTNISVGEDNEPIYYSGGVWTPWGYAIDYK